ADLPSAERSRRWSTDPALTRSRVAETAVATGRVEFVRGADARAFVRDDGGVTVRGIRGDAPFEVRGAFLVGDDGAASRVRASLAGRPLGGGARAVRACATRGERAVRRDQPPRRRADRRRSPRPARAADAAACGARRGPESMDEGPRVALARDVVRRRGGSA